MIREDGSIRASIHKGNRDSLVQLARFFVVFVKVRQSSFLVSQLLLHFFDKAAIAENLWIDQFLLQLLQVTLGLHDIGFQVRDFAIRKLAFALDLGTAAVCVSRRTGCAGFTSAARWVIAIRVGHGNGTAIGDRHALLEPMTKVIVVADNLTGLTVAENDDMVGNGIDQVTIMSHEQNGSVELLDCCFERLSRPQIQVVRRFVEHQKVGFERAESCEHDSVAFTTGEHSQRFGDNFACQSECGQDVSSLFIDIVAIGNAHRFERFHIQVELLEQLIKVAHADMRAKRHCASIGLDFPEQALQQS